MPTVASLLGPKTRLGMPVAQAKVLEDSGLPVGGPVRYGLGKLMPEPPSNKAGDDTALVPSMVLTVEPSAKYGDGRIIMHEEEVVVTADGPELLTRRALVEMLVIRP